MAMLFLRVFTWLRVLMRHPGMSWDVCFSVLLSFFLSLLPHCSRGSVRYIDRPTRPAAKASLGRCEQMRARKASGGAGGQWPPATSRPLRTDARKALGGVGGQWPPARSRPGGGKLPPKDLEEPVMGNGFDVPVYIESGPPVSVKILSNGIPTYRRIYFDRL
jgi:hypothetical protein